jgi:hypothetical protein
MGAPRFDDIEGEIVEVPGAPMFDAIPGHVEGTRPGPMSTGRAMVKGVQDIPTFGFGDELGAGFQAFLASLPEEVAEKVGIDNTFPQDPREVYRAARSDNRAESKQAADEHPAAYYGAGIAAAAPVAAITTPFRAAVGAGLGARAVIGGVNGLIQGGVAGVGSSESETGRGMARDALKTGLAGGALGTSLPVAGDIARWAAQPLAKGFERLGLNQGRKVLTNGADSLSSRKPVSDEAVREAYDSGGLRAFSNTQKTFERLEGLTGKEAQVYGRIIEDLESRGVRGPEAMALAEELFNRAMKLEPNTMNNALPQAFLEEAENVMGKARGGTHLGLGQSESLKKSLQDKARYGRIEDKPLNDVRKEIASVFRQANEDAITGAGAAAHPGSEIRTLAESFVPTRGARRGGARRRCAPRAALRQSH